jgi:ribosomal protein S18 acetylase RimI-like enzyme
MEGHIRLAGPGDAAALLELQSTLDRESRFMVLEPGERPTDPGDLRDRLAEQRRPGGDPSYTFVAADTGELAGYVSVTVLPYTRARRSGYVVMGVRDSRAGQGVGRALLEAAIEHARARDMRRLELTVMAHNRPALSLYLSCGFLVEGLRRRILWIDGGDIDEYYMGLLL